MKKLHELWQVILCIYLMLLFGVYPFYFKNQYSGMGGNKYRFFMVITLAFLCIALFTGFFCTGIKLYKKQSVIKKGKRLSLLDKWMLAYGTAAAFSFLLCEEKRTGFLGQEGWYMGFLVQLIFLALYFIISYTWKWDNAVIIVLCIASAGVFLLGILHRFYIDPLGMYAGMDKTYTLKFLSTIGQATWYSSYLCTLFPVGLFYFWYSRNEKIRILAGAYCAAAFGTLVTQNSDSAFFALGAVFLMLFWKAFDSAFFRKRFLETLLLLLASFVGMGTLQILFVEHTAALDGLSLFFSQSLWMWAVFVIILVIYAFWCLYEKKEPEEKNDNREEKRSKKIRAALFILAGIAATGVLFFVFLNTRGYWQKWFGVTVSNNYLYFDETWGNNRGFTWRFSAKMFGELPFLRKLFGVGPDCFASYAYGIPAYAVQLSAMWGESALTNAHNELLNGLICYGIVGGAAYTGIFVAAAIRFWKGFPKTPFGFAVVMCIISYLAHNFFCYQQIVCTPFLFVLLGMAESCFRSGRRKEEESHGKKEK